jgi:tetratricopeptide (TPR) repeat protein
MGKQAITEFEKAIELQPSLETAHNWLGFLHLLVGQPESAVDHATRAIELNPLAPASHLYPSLTYLANGNVEQALRQVRRAKEIQPEWGEVYAFEGVMLFHNKQYAEALEALEIAEKLIGKEANSVWIPDISSMMTLTKLAIGDTLESYPFTAAASLEINPFWIGINEAALDRKDLAMASFNEIEQFSMWPNLSLRYFFPEILDPLREDARYRQLIVKMNEQWE